ncbi:hypothetical protein PHYSODRAFT_502568 [Phytophthora sojae]|uniref:Uncharacterized protein n=1 Tax=Phytophthora sojae (strain P6497) TaxID=1094619 RepID=G4ZFA0_PHYSP|nr:hypothetical protein PHYSODRAFT_502568 [Phytophthora sojae]EGZ16603.1 hypothetical protein PHYSODRAFT_502568 [Phytophthora sojae]|eukprot:XP_009525661.1 hypothetical protein PHYSODRAFT_502568 [Phytophthora sojae]
MGKSTEHNVTQEEFYKLEQVLNQTVDDASNCLKLLKKHLSDYDSRNGNHFVNTASHFMRGDIRTAKDTAMDLKHVAHKINKSHKPSKAEVSSARNMMDATSKAMDTLKITARNYDKENGQSMGVKGRIDAAVGGHHDHDKEKHEQQHGLLGKSLFGRSEKDKEHEGGLFGKSDKEKEHEGGGLFGKSDKEKEHRGGMLDNPDNNGGGIMGSSDTVETLVKKTLRDNFSLNALDQQIKAAEKSLSPSIAERAKPSIVDRAKEAMHDVKDKLKGDKSSSAHHESHPHEGLHDEGHHAQHTAMP